MTTADPQPFLHQMQRVEALVAAVEQGTDPVARNAAQDLVRTLLGVHSNALATMLDFLTPIDRDACAADELVSHVLLIHGLHPWDTATRIQHALEGVRPLVLRGGGEVEMLSLDADRVRVRLESEPGCASTVLALKGAVQRAILDAAPEIAAVDVEGFGAAEPALLQVGILPLASAALEKCENSSRILEASVNGR